MNALALRYTRYKISFVILGFVVGLLCLRVGLQRRTADILQLTAFLLLGISYLVVLQREFADERRTGSIFYLKGWYAVLLLCLQLMVGLGLLYLLTDNSLAMAFASTCIFLVPFTIANAWSLFLDMPEKQFKRWSFPEIEPERRTMPLVKSMPVKMRTSRKYSDGREEVFLTTVPNRIRLGLLFYYFLQDQRKKDTVGIEYMDRGHRPYDWEFYTSSTGGVLRRYLDPELTLDENGINANTIINARRVHRMNTLL